MPTSVPAELVAHSSKPRNCLLVLLLAMATVSGVPAVYEMGTLIDQPLGLMTVAVRSAASIWAGVIEHTGEPKLLAKAPGDKQSVARLTIAVSVTRKLAILTFPPSSLDQIAALEVAPGRTASQAARAS